jgi:hypothetical protein
VIGVTLGPAWRSAQNQNTKLTLTSTRDNSTNIDLINAAIAVIEAQDKREYLLYIEVANKFSISRHTLA